MRRAARTDRNHADVMTAFRQMDCSVFDASGVGGGFPDLVVGIAGTTVLVEVKDGTKPPSRRKLNGAQLVFAEHWRGGNVEVVENQEDAIKLVYRYRPTLTPERNPCSPLKPRPPRPRPNAHAYPAAPPERA